MNTENDFLENLGRFYGDLSTLNKILDLGCELGNADLLFAIEIIDFPYTMVYTPASDKVKEIAKNINGLSGIDDADAFVLFFDRTVLGSHETGIKAALAIKHGGAIQGGAADRTLGENLGAFLRVAVSMNTFLSSNPLYTTYKELNVETSGVLLSVRDNTIKGTVVTGKNRPDLDCRDTLTPQYLFASEKPIVTARPYVDELKEEFRKMGEDFSLDNEE